MEVDAAQLLAAHGRNPFSGFVRYDAPWQWFEADGGAAPYLEHGRVALAWADPLAGDPAAFLAALTRELCARRRRICFVLIGEEVARAARATSSPIRTKQMRRRCARNSPVKSPRNAAGSPASGSAQASATRPCSRYGAAPASVSNHCHGASYRTKPENGLRPCAARSCAASTSTARAYAGD